jgi:hypothetical protein
LYTFLKNTWNTLPESYQQRVYKNTLAIVKHQIQQAENPMPGEVFSTEAEPVKNAIHLDYVTAEVVFEDPEIRSNDPNIPIDNHCTDDELHYDMTGGCEDYDNGGDEIDRCDAIPPACGRRLATTELEWFDLGTRNVDGYERDDADDADADAEEEASQANDSSMQTLEDRGYSTRECEDWIVYFRPVI